MKRIIIGLLKTLFVLAIIAVFALVVDYIRLSISYSFNKSKYVNSIEIQGNKDKYVPQGLAYNEEYDVVLQTSYNKSHKVSVKIIKD